MDLDPDKSAMTTLSVMFVGGIKKREALLNYCKIKEQQRASL